MKPPLVLAFDLGGTRLKAGLVDPAAARVLRRRVEPSPPGAAEALALVARVGRELAAGDDVDAVGLCVPGLVDGSGRVVALPGKLDGIVGLDLVGCLQAAFAVPAAVVNDAIAFGLGETRVGAGAGAARVVVVTIGTGVGVGVFEHGVPLGRGPLGGGLLGGQIPVFEDPHGPVDTNGRTGTIEARCAAARIAEAAQRSGFACSDAAAVFAAAADPRAAAAIAVYRRDLARALVALAHAHAPDCIVLGGGPMVAGNPVVDGLEAMVNADLWPGYRVAVRLAACGDDAGLLGVAALAAAGAV